MALAISSLPVPLSPMMSTVESVCETILTFSRTEAIASLRATMPLNWYLHPTCSLRSSFSCSSDLIFIRRLTISNSSSIENGLVT